MLNPMEAVIGHHPASPQRETAMPRPVQGVLQYSNQTGEIKLCQKGIPFPKTHLS